MASAGRKARLVFQAVKGTCRSRKGDTEQVLVLRARRGGVPEGEGWKGWRLSKDLITPPREAGVGVEPVGSAPSGHQDRPCREVGKDRGRTRGWATRAEALCVGMTPLGPPRRLCSGIYQA